MALEAVSAELLSPNSSVDRESINISDVGAAMRVMGRRKGLHAGSTPISFVSINNWSSTPQEHARRALRGIPPGVFPKSSGALRGRGSEDERGRNDLFCVCARISNKCVHARNPLASKPSAASVVSVPPPAFKTAASRRLLDVLHSFIMR